LATGQEALNHIPYSDGFLLFCLFVYSIDKQHKAANHNYWSQWIVKVVPLHTITMAAMPLAPHLMIRKPIFINKLGITKCNPTKLRGQVIDWRTKGWQNILVSLIGFSIVGNCQFP
jgi:hypothetical protein